MPFLLGVGLGRTFLPCDGKGLSLSGGRLLALVGGWRTWELKNSL